MSKRGFTLIEALIYIAILSAVFVMFVNALLAINKSFAVIRTIMTQNAAAVSSMERMTREIRGSVSVDAASVLGANPGTLILNQADGSKITFLLINQSLHLELGGVDQGALLPASVTIPRLVFYKLDSGVSTAVKIEMQIQDKESGVTRAGSYYDTVILRGSYK